MQLQRLWKYTGVGLVKNSVGVNDITEYAEDGRLTMGLDYKPLIDFDTAKAIALVKKLKRPLTDEELKAIPPR